MDVVTIFKVVIALLLFLSGLAWGWWYAVGSQHLAGRAMRHMLFIGSLGIVPALIGAWLMYRL